MVLNLCTLSDDDLIPSFMKISSTVSGLWSEHISVLKITKGHHSVKNIDRIWLIFSAGHLMMFYICTKFCADTICGGHNTTM